MIPDQIKETRVMDNQRGVRLELLRVGLCMRPADSCGPQEVRRHNGFWSRDCSSCAIPKGLQNGTELCSSVAERLIALALLPVCIFSSLA